MGTPGGATCYSRPLVSTISVACVQGYLRRWYRWWTATLLTVVAVAVLAGGTSFYGRATNRGTDFNVFYLGGHLVTEAPEELYERASKRGSTYTFINPPFFAILMWPLAALPIEVSTVAWFVVNVVCTGHSAWILSRLLAPPGLTAAFLAMTLLLALPYTLENIFLGQLHAVILYLMVLSFAAIRRRRGAIVGAAGVAVATAIKLLPAIFGVYFLIRREWRAFASFVLLLAVTSVAVPAMFLGPRTAFALLGEFYQLQVGPYLSGESTQHEIYVRTAVRKTPHDQDLGALLMRHFTAEHEAGGLLLARVNPRVVRSAMFGLFAAILAISVATAWPRAGDRVTEPQMTDLVFAVFVMLSLLLSPRNRMAYWTVLMIPWAVLLGRLMDSRTPTRSRCLAGFTLGVSAIACVLVEVYIIRAFTIGFWGQAALWGGLVAMCHEERRAARLTSDLERSSHAANKHSAGRAES